MVLTAVRDYEQGNPAGLATLVGPDDAVKTYLGAIAWSTDMVRSVDPAGSGRTVMSNA